MGDGSDLMIRRLRNLSLSALCTLFACHPSARPGLTSGDAGTTSVIGDHSSDDTGDGGADGGSNCGQQNFMLVQPNPPDVLIVLDQSVSMNDDSNDMTLPAPLDPSSKWMQTITALEQAVQTVKAVHWGLMLFGAPASAGFCSYYLQPNVPVSSISAPFIKMTLDGITPNAATPTHLAMLEATSYYQQLNDNHPHYIVLATDGEPTCANVVNGMIDLSHGINSPEFTDPVPAEMAVAAAATASIHTFVVGGNTGADDALSVMAVNGLEPNTTAGEKPYYSVSSTSEFVDVMNKVAGTIISCDYPLAMPPAYPDLVSIQGNSGTIPRDPSHMNGWDFNSDQTSVTFYGTACQNLQLGVTTSISALYDCPTL